MDLMQRLDGMVAAELAAVDGLTDAEALMAIANLHIAIAAHTAVTAAREYLQREPQAEKWRAVTDDHFARAVARRIGIDENRLTGEAL
jgi:hypothetical protein